MFILTKIGPVWYFLNKRTDGIDFSIRDIGTVLMYNSRAKYPLNQYKIYIIKRALSIIGQGTSLIV
jgi:hypothetical protein